MRANVREAVTELPTVPDDILAEVRSRAGSLTPEAHARYLNALPAFHLIEAVPPRIVAAWPSRLTVASFNAERLKDSGAVRTLLDEVGSHVSLLTEVDIGMARSGNTHTMHDLTAGTGEGYLFGLEFLELDLGDESEMKTHAGEVNRRAFHGNAIVSDLRLERPHLIPLEESGFWFPGQNGAQRRIGGRIALAARLVDSPFPLWVVTVHLESKTTAQDRQRQIQALLRGLDRFAAGEACIIGGDLNTKDLPSDSQDWTLADAERFEPLFGDLRREGFAWTAANLAVPTQRTGPSGKPRGPFRKLDWIFVRGIAPDDPRVVPALDAQGRPISDHEMLALDLLFDPDA